MEFRILLVSLNDGNVPVESYGSTEHLGLAYLASRLRKDGYVVKAIDAYATNTTLPQIIEDTVAFSPHLVGVTTEYNTFESAIEYCSKIKNICKGIPICVFR